MQHIRGHILSDARLSAKSMRPDFGVITHLHDVGVLSDAKFEAARMGGAQHRPSSGTWNEDDDRTLLALRAMGKNWNQIQREAFPGKTGNACRKRHERLMERRGQTEFDNQKLERLCTEYMAVRKEIWQPLASRYGEKWNIVEMQVRHSPSPSSTSLLH